MCQDGPDIRVIISLGLHYCEPCNRWVKDCDHDIIKILKDALGE